MAINNDTATVSVEINSEQAKAKLDQLRRDTKKFTDALEEARRTGDKVAMVAAALHRSVPNLYRLLLKKQLRRKDWLLNRYKYLNFVRKHFANTYFFNLSIKRALTTS